MSSLETLVAKLETVSMTDEAGSSAVSTDPTFLPIRSFGESPGPRCGHTLTHVKLGGGDGKDVLVLFGGMSEKNRTSPPSVSGIEAVADAHVFDVSMCNWKRLPGSQKTPSARVAHGATAVGSMVIVHGGIGPTGLSSSYLHILDFKSPEPQWSRLIIPGEGPEYRYGHVLVSVGERFLICLGGNDGRNFLNDVWQLDMADRPYMWTKLESKGEGPPPFMYSSGSVTSDGVLLLHGGIINKSREPLQNTYQLTGLRNGSAEWNICPGASPTPKHQHAAAVTLNSDRVFIIGGIVATEQEQASSNVAVFNTKTPSWNQFSDNHIGKRHKHAAACVGETVFIYGGLHESEVLGDFLASEDVRPNFSYEDLKKATMNFSKEMRLGGGGFGEVYRAELEHFGKLAIKKVREEKKPQKLEDAKKQLEVELAALSRVSHKNLIQMYGYCCGEEDGDEVVLLVLEFSDKGSLSYWMEETQTREWKDVVGIIRDIAKGLNHLHNELRPLIIHRDIKPDNVLLFQVGDQIVSKISDFGLAKEVNKDGTQTLTFRTKNPAGAFAYMDPEYLKSSIVSKNIDIFAFGIIILELLTGLPARFKDGIRLLYYLGNRISEGAHYSEFKDKRLNNVNEDQFSTLWNIAYSDCCCEKWDDRKKIDQILKEIQTLMEQLET